MRFGLNFPLAGIFSNLRVTTELAREAEASGWDGFFVWDHILIDGAHSVADPWLALALIADATSRLVIGPLVTPLYRRHPAKLAQETVTLDHLSNGRLILGAGLGSDEFSEISVFGGPLDDVIRAQLLDEGLEILAGLWTGKQFSFDGDHYHIQDAQMVRPPCNRRAYHCGSLLPGGESVRCDGLRDSRAWSRCGAICVVHCRLPP